MNYFFHILMRVVIKIHKYTKKVDIDRKLFFKIRCNNNYISIKYVIIKLCLALELDRTNFNRLLNVFTYAVNECKFGNDICMISGFATNILENLLSLEQFQMIFIVFISNKLIKYNKK